MRAHALVVVVDRHRQGTFRRLLAYDVLFEEREDLPGLRKIEIGDGAVTGLGHPLFDDLVAELDALVADVHAGPGDELLHLLLALTAERALEQISALTDACHQGSSSFRAAVVRA